MPRHLSRLQKSQTEYCPSCLDQTPFHPSCRTGSASSTGLAERSRPYCKQLLVHFNGFISHWLPISPTSARYATNGLHMTTNGACSPCFMWLIYGQLLLSTEDSVARIAQTGNDVSVFIQSLVHRAGVDAHVRIRVEDRLDALGCGDKNQEANILDALAA